MFETEIKEIFRLEAGFTPQRIARLTGGIGSDVYEVVLHGKSFVIRLKEHYQEVYRKEQWAMEQAAQAGVPVAPVHAVGQHRGRAYMIQDKVAGTAGTNYQGDVIALHKEIGRLARKVNEVEVTGYGFPFSLDPIPHFTGQWQDVVEQDRQFIFGTDALIRLEALAPEQMLRAERYLEDLGTWKKPSRLGHNDLSLDNVIVGADGRIHIIDWTLAQGLPAPSYEIGNFSTWTRDKARIDAFVEGYGLSHNEWQAVKPDIDRVTLATALRATVWSEMEAPGKLEHFVSLSRNLARELLHSHSSRAKSLFWSLPQS